jgi:crossover junction endodeoxyribonuclease RuvC
MTVIGIDPGFSGAIAIYDAAERDLLIFDMPISPGPKGKTDLLMGALFDILARPSTDVWVENVGAMPGQGVSSMFRFGQTVGAIHMAVAARGHSLRLVTPVKWKNHFRLSRDKGAARGLAAQRFPTSATAFARVKDDGRAEAALIALYGAEVGA